MSDKPENKAKTRPLKPEDLRTYGLEAVKIQEQKLALAEKIEQVSRRLMAGYSKPLDDYRVELMAQDMKLSCQLTDILTK